MFKIMSMAELSERYKGTRFLAPSRDDFLGDICAQSRTPIEADVELTVHGDLARTRTFTETLKYLEICESPLGKVIDRFGAWCVTSDGVESLSYPYVIEKLRVHESNWEKHLCEKCWVVPLHIFAALEFARVAFKRKTKVSRGVRFRVFRRDGYRCRICGVTAANGAVLEIDHKVPRAKGGTNAESNLWVLCFDCNRGKKASDL